MYKDNKIKWPENEKILETDLSAFVPIIAVVTIIVMGICLVPNGPRIVKHHPSEAETEQTRTETPGSNTPVRRSLGFFEVTAYCPCELCCGEWSDGVTASGHVIRPGDKFVAADPLVPFGTRLDVPGYGEVPVLDWGGAIRGRKLDAFFPTHAEALEWGRQTLEIHCWVWE